MQPTNWDRVIAFRQEEIAELAKKDARNLPSPDVGQFASYNPLTSRFGFCFTSLLSIHTHIIVRQSDPESLHHIALEL